MLTGEVGIAFATAGPGVTNCVTAIANAPLERVPVLLIGGCAPVSQDDLGPLQGIDHVSIMRPVTRCARTLRGADNILRDLDKAWSTAIGDGNAPGPVYVEIPTDVLRKVVPPASCWRNASRPSRRGASRPTPRRCCARRGWSRGEAAARHHRPRRDGRRPELLRFLDASGAVYLDTQESRGLVPGSHASFVGAVRARVMKDADLVLSIGRKLDYQTGYGSPAVLPDARWIRIGDNAEELRENRRGEVELFADPRLALAAIADALPKAKSVDAEWATACAPSTFAARPSYATS